jgi:Leucine-rich repeat (LRR) protein
MLLDLIEEDNFLHLVNNPKAMEQVKDPGIRRLTVVVGLRDVEDDTKLTVSMSWNLSHIRSLAILGYSDWTPLLLDLKFLRVLSLQTSYGIVVDLTCINQLLQLRYFNVRGKVMLPCQIRGLRHLETLDLSESSHVTAINNSTLEIVDVPCLTNLLLPQDTASNVNLVCTLENIIGVDELNTHLLDLGFHLPKRCAPLAKATWMAALSTSLEKLSNLRRLVLYYDEVVGCVDQLSSLSPSFYKLEHLHMAGCTFSRVPRWIGHLRNLRELTLGVKQMVQEDFAIIGTGSPSLLRLFLRIAGILAERIVIRGSMGFASVKYFEFNYDCISHLSFEASAISELRELKLVFDANEWDKAAPGGLQHLPRLKKIVAQRSYYNTAEWKGRNRASNDEDANKAEELIRGVFQKAADALPTCPTFVLEDG